jgi:hypothetical protein
MGYTEFQKDWERAAGEEYDRYLAMQPTALIWEVKDRHYGECYQLWRAISSVSTLADAGLALLEVIRRDTEPYLIRSHAASALLALLGASNFEPVDLSADRPQRAANIAAVEEMLRERIGPSEK